MINQAIRIGSVISDNLIQIGLQTIIQPHNELNLVFTTAHHDNLVELCQNYTPDILLWLILPHVDQIVSVISAHCQLQRTPVLILATTFDDAVFYTLLKAGICGYFCTYDDAELLANAIHVIAKGNKWYSPSITVHLLQQRMAEVPLLSRGEHSDNLTDREVQILQMVAQGWSNQKIGQHLGVTERTIRSHMRNIYDKLHLANRAEAIAWTLRTRLS